jgi:outer membrane protein assembly factor BamB
MGWSLPAVNVKTDRIIAGSNFMALKNVFCFDTKTGKELWTNGGFGTNAASIMLTSNDASGAAIVGGFDGILRAFSQNDGKQIWKFNARDHIYSSPSQLKDGTIIQASTDGTVYAINPQMANLNGRTTRLSQSGRQRPLTAMITYISAQATAVYIA